MLTAINRVHLKNGPWVQQGGYEYPAVAAAAAVALAESGPGALSLDALRGKERSGAGWGLFSLALGAAGAAGAHFLAESRATSEPSASEPAAASASVNGSDPVAAAPTPTDAPAVETPAAESSFPEESGSEAPSSDV
jgi:putative oxidoreductase